ncbi:MAG: hypothetical protein AAGB31_04765 [Bdellovibrio sp.]
MIVLAWFCFLGVVVLVGFGLVAATLIHWYQEKKKIKSNAS